MDAANIDAVLLARLLDCLITDDEYLEEIYQECNFEIVELLDSDRYGVILLRGYAQRFRLSEILEGLNRLIKAGVINAQDDKTFSPAASVGRIVYSLTELGKTWWEKHVPSLESLGHDCLRRVPVTEEEIKPGA